MPNRSFCFPKLNFLTQFLVSVVGKQNLFGLEHNCPHPILAFPPTVIQLHCRDQYNNPDQNTCGMLCSFVFFFLFFLATLSSLKRL